MKKLFIIFVCLFVFSKTRSSENIIEGRMNCVIKDQVVKDITDGKVSTFGGIKNSLSTGDSFELSYKFISPSSFKLKTSGNYFRNETRFNLKETTDVDINKKSQVIYAINRPYKEIFMYESLELRRNLISVNHVGESMIEVNRYYKGDWEGTIVNLSNLKNSPIIVHNLFFDCKHSSTDNWTKVFESLIDLKP